MELYRKDPRAWQPDRRLLEGRNGIRLVQMETAANESREFRQCVIR
jgi:hypothetical protein